MEGLEDPSQPLRGGGSISKEARTEATGLRRRSGPWETRRDETRQDSSSVNLSSLSVLTQATKRDLVTAEDGHV